MDRVPSGFCANMGGGQPWPALLSTSGMAHSEASHLAECGWTFETDAHIEWFHDLFIIHSPGNTPFLGCSPSWQSSMELACIKLLSTIAFHFLRPRPSKLASWPAVKHPPVARSTKLYVCQIAIMGQTMIYVLKKIIFASALLFISQCAQNNKHEI